MYTRKQTFHASVVMKCGEIAGAQTSPRLCREGVRERIRERVRERV
jgi:hypothetical protein